MQSSTNSVPLGLCYRPSYRKRLCELEAEPEAFFAPDSGYLHLADGVRLSGRVAIDDLHPPAQGW